MRLCAFAREKEYYSRQAAKASGRQKLQKLNAKDLSGATDKSGPQFLCVSAPLREENSPRRIGKQEISEGPVYAFGSGLQLAGAAPLREKKNITPKIRALFFSPTYSGFQESRVGPEYPNSTFL